MTALPSNHVLNFPHEHTVLLLVGDSGSVAIGEGSNVQDDVVIGSGRVSVGAGVTIGHGAIIKVGLSLKCDCGCSGLQYCCAVGADPTCPGGRR